MSTTTIIISLLSVLVGYVAQAVNTGSLFGVATVPQKWIPYLSLFGTFLAAFVTSVATANPVNNAAWMTALIAGFAALTGNTVGVTMHQHLKAKPANDNAEEKAA